MLKRRRSTVVFLRTLGLVAIALLGCSGPQSLEIAIRPDDRRDFHRELAEHGQSPKLASFAAKAAKTGKDVDTIAIEDASVSSNHNPFDANHDPAAVSGGAVIYEAMCMRCHGADVRGGGPDMLASHPTKDFHAFGKRFAVTLHGGAPRTWYRKISEGFGDTVEYREGLRTAMPAFGDVLSREQIWLVITYLQSLDAFAEKR